MEEDFETPFVNMIGTTLSAKPFLSHAMETSRGHYNRWSRQVIEAIGKDDCLKMCEVYSKYRLLGANINEQVDMYGFAGYTWTVWNHQYLGDTALHIALKQKKINCVCMLLIMEGIDLSHKNNENKTPNDLSMELYGQSIFDIEREARDILYRVLDPRDFFKLPFSLRHHRIKEEAWKLMNEGRSLYVEPPMSFYREVIKERLPMWTWQYHKSKGPYMQHRETKEVRKLSPKEVYIFNRKWQEEREKSGWKIYRHEWTGETVDSDDLPEYIIYQLNNSYDETEDEKQRIIDGQLYRQHLALLDAQRDLILSTSKPNKFNAVNALARHEPQEYALKRHPLITKQLIEEVPEFVMKLRASILEQPGSPTARISVASNIEVDIPLEMEQSISNTSVQMQDGIQPSPDSPESRAPFETFEPLADQGSLVSPSIEQDLVQGSLLLGENPQLEASMDMSIPRSLSPNVLGESSLVESVASLAESLPLENSNASLDGTLDGRVINTAKIPVAKQPVSEMTFLQEYYSGHTTTPAGLGTGDVWGRGIISDVILLVRRQKLRQSKRDLAELKRKSGLGLLASTGDVGFFFQEQNDEHATRPDQEIFGSHQAKFKEAQEPLADRLTKQLPELKGIGKLKFVKMKQLNTMIQEEYAEDVKPIPSGVSGEGHNGDSKSIAEASKVKTKQDYSAVESEPKSIEAELEALNQKRDALDLPERAITCLSTETNMKYLHVGNVGLELLSKELVGDVQIKALVLSCARVSCTGVMAFATCLEKIRGLTYLDLTQNGISDKGALALADAIAESAIEKQIISDSVLSTEPVMQPKHPLKVLLLAGNRIGQAGAMRLVEVMLNSGTNLQRLSLSRNKLTTAEENRLLRTVFDFNASAVGRHDKIQKELEELERLRLEELSRKGNSKKRNRAPKPAGYSLSTKIIGGLSSVFQTVGNALSSKRASPSPSSRSDSDLRNSWLPLFSSKKRVMEENNNAESINGNSNDVLSATGLPLEVDVNGNGEILENGIESTIQPRGPVESSPKKSRIQFAVINANPEVRDSSAVLPEESRNSLLCQESDYSPEYVAKYKIKFLCI